MKKTSFKLLFVGIGVFSTLPLSAGNKEQEMSAILAIDSRRPIEFYGRVIDQHGNPVPDARVRGAAEIVERWMDQKWDEHFTVSDADGHFHFAGLHGQTLVVSPNKEGYEYKSDNVAFSYSGLGPEKERHRPNAKSPVVFTMWKLAGPEPLKHVEYNRSRVPVDNTPTAFDLLTGYKVPIDSDLILRIDRHPEHIKRGQRFDWKVVLEAPSGGIVEHNDKYPNEAPADGYEKQLTIEMPASVADWKPSVTRSFYLKARDGKLYARVTITITADYEPPPTAVTLEAWTNPSGSRNLEYDPKKTLP